MMELNEILDKLASANLQELLALKKDLIRMHASYASQYAASLVSYSQAFTQIKEAAYKITISECKQQAGEQTGYRHKEIIEQIEAIKEAISLVDDMIQLGPSVALGSPLQTSPEDASESASQTESK